MKTQTSEPVIHGFPYPRWFSNCPAFYTASPSIQDPGYTINPLLPCGDGHPETAPPAGQKLFDFRSMTPNQRAHFKTWAKRPWSATPPINAFFEAILHGVEADLMLNQHPSSENIPLLIFMLNHHRAALAERKQVRRVMSLLEWCALGHAPTRPAELVYSDIIPEYGDLNPALSVLYGHRRTLDAKIAHRVCVELHRRRGGVDCNADVPAFMGKFERAIDERWPGGFWLQQPCTEILVTHQPGHPETALAVAAQPNARVAWDFFADPAQFTEILALSDNCMAVSTVQPSVEDSAAVLQNPNLQELAGLPPDAVAEWADAKIRDATASFLEREELAKPMAESGNSGFGIDSLNVDAVGITFGKDGMHVPFEFVISGDPNDVYCSAHTISGDAAATFWPGGRIVFDVSSAELGREDEDLDSDPGNGDYE